MTHNPLLKEVIKKKISSFDELEKEAFFGSAKNLVKLPANALGRVSGWMSRPGPGLIQKGRAKISNMASNISNVAREGYQEGKLRGLVGSKLKVSAKDFEPSASGSTLPRVVKGPGNTYTSVSDPFMGTAPNLAQTARQSATPKTTPSIESNTDRLRGMYSSQQSPTTALGRQAQSGMTGEQIMNYRAPNHGLAPRPRRQRVRTNAMNSGSQLNPQQPTQAAPQSSSLLSGTVMPAAMIAGSTILPSAIAPSPHEAITISQQRVPPIINSNAWYQGQQ